MKRLRIKKALVWLTCIDAIPGMLGIGRDGDLFPHLAAHLKVFGDLVQIPSELIGCGRAIKRRVVADGAKEWFPLIQILAVFAETVSGKGRLAILAFVDPLRTLR